MTPTLHWTRRRLLVWLASLSLVTLILLSWAFIYRPAVHLKELQETHKISTETTAFPGPEWLPYAISRRFPRATSIYIKPGATELPPLRPHSHISSIKFSSEDLKRGSVADLRNAPKLLNLSIYHMPSEGRVLLHGANKLINLELFDGRVDQIEGWEDFESLWVLELDGDDRGASFPPLPRPEEIGYLAMNARAMDLSQVPWNKLSNLKTLQLRDIPGGTVVDLQQLWSLQYLSLYDQKEKARVLLPSTLPGLSCVGLEVELSDLLHWPSSARLTSLHLEKVQVKTIPPEMLRHLKELRTFDLELDRTTWQRIAEAPDLKAWSAKEVNLPQIDGFPSLRELYLPSPTDLSFGSVPRLETVEMPDGTFQVDRDPDGTIHLVPRK